MRVQAVKTPIVTLKQSLWPLLREALHTHGGLPEQTVIAISSKIISYSQGRLVPKTAADLADPAVCLAHKHQLAQEEADQFLPASESRYQLLFAVKNHTLTISAGIDQSNAGDYFVLWPTDLPQVLAELWQQLRTEFGVKQVGLVVTDSKLYPLRWGIMGTCLAHCGFRALNDCRGKLDLFGRPMQIEQVNVAEAVAIAAVLEMGEVAEQQPLALVTEIKAIEFQDKPPTAAERAALLINLADDAFAPFLQAVPWQAGGGG